MKMDLETLVQIVEEQIPTARVTCVTGANQIVATFSNRPDVEVAFLTPYFQAQLPVQERADSGQRRHSDRAQQGRNDERSHPIQM